MVCTTGQHRELLYDVIREFGIEVDYDLDIMRDSQPLHYVNTAILNKFSSVLDAESPDAVAVHGDTATAFAVALACFYKGVSVYHVEAGLRTGNVLSPFPEEFNRRAVALIADIHFAPTRAAAENLFNEGIRSSKVFVTGNTVVDALRYTLKDGYTHPLLNKHNDKRIIFFTAHRRENQGEGIRRILAVIKRIVRSYPDVCVIYPVHPNPSIAAVAKSLLDGCERIELCNPLGVVDCHNLMSRSYAIITDSGGIQEEGVALGRPVFIIRNTTERPEGILCGGACLAGTDPEQIFVTVSRVLDDKRVYKRMCSASNPYGDGTASFRITDVIEESL